MATTLTHEQIADKFIALLKVKCTRGIYVDHLFRQVSHGPAQFYPLEKLLWMEKFLDSENQQIAADCLRCLCLRGKQLSDYRQVLQDRIQDKVFSSKVIALAEDLNDPNSLILYMDEQLYYVNRVIIALKRTHNESFLTPFMFSENETLARAVMKIAKQQ